MSEIKNIFFASEIGDKTNVFVIRLSAENNKSKRVLSVLNAG